MNFEEFGYAIDCKISSFNYWFRKNILREKPKPIDPRLKPLIDITLAANADELVKNVSGKNVLLQKLLSRAEDK